MLFSVLWTSILFWWKLLPIRWDFFKKFCPLCLHDNVAYQIKVIEILSSFFNQKIKNNHFFCLFSYSFYPKLLCKIQIKFIVWKSFCCFQLCMLWLWDRKSFLNPKQNYSIHGFLQCKNLPSLVKILRFILFFIFLSPHFPKQNLYYGVENFHDFHIFQHHFIHFCRLA